MQEPPLLTFTVELCMYTHITTQDGRIQLNNTINADFKEVERMESIG